MKPIFKKAYNNLLKITGFVTIMLSIVLVGVFGGYWIFTSLILFLIGILLYLIDLIIKMITIRYYGVIQFALSMVYIVFVGWYFMAWQEHTNINFQSDKGATGIVFGIEGYPQLPKTYFWVKNITLPNNSVIITSTKEADMPKWLRYKFNDDIKVTDSTVNWNPNIAYKCILKKKVIKAWIFTINNNPDTIIQKKITELSNLINRGRLNTIYKTSDDLLAMGNGEYITLQGEGLSFLPDAVGDLNINTIYLADNKFTTIPPQLYKIKNLQHIYLGANPIKELPYNLFKLKRLKSLLLSSTLIRDIRIDMSKLDSLEDFDISSDKLTTLPEQIKRLPNLKWLSADENEFKDLSFVDKRLSKLVTLQVFTNKIKNISNVKYLTNLKELLIFDNQIDSIPDEIGDMVNLEKLEIWDNPIRYISPQIKKLSKLREMRIDDNNLSQTDKVNLKQWLPNCKINYQTRGN